MRNRIFAILGAIGCATICPPALAAGWSGDLTITASYTEDGLMVIYTSGGTGYTSGCVTNSWVFSGSNEENRARAWATILTAQASGRKIRFWYTDTCGAFSFHNGNAIMMVQ